MGETDTKQVNKPDADGAGRWEEIKKESGWRGWLGEMTLEERPDG